jgi:hypothetical protein
LPDVCSQSSEFLSFLRSNEMMTSNELFYGDSEPVYVVDSSPYPRRSGHASSYGSDRYYSGRPGSAGGYYRGSSYGRSSDYTGDRYTDIDGYRGSEYYRSRPDYYSSDPYYSGSQTAAYGAAYDDTYFDSKPYEYYDYRRPSAMLIPTRIRTAEDKRTRDSKDIQDGSPEGPHMLRGLLRRGPERFV